MHSEKNSGALPPPPSQCCTVITIPYYTLICSSFRTKEITNVVISLEKRWLSSLYPVLFISILPTCFLCYVPMLICNSCPYRDYLQQFGAKKWVIHHLQKLFIRTRFLLSKVTYKGIITCVLLTAAMRSAKCIGNLFVHAWWMCDYILNSKINVVWIQYINMAVYIPDALKTIQVAFHPSIGFSDTVMIQKKTMHVKLLWLSYVDDLKSRRFFYCSVY